MSSEGERSCTDNRASRGRREFGDGNAAAWTCDMQGDAINADGGSRGTMAGDVVCPLVSAYPLIDGGVHRRVEHESEQHENIDETLE